MSSKDVYEQKCSEISGWLDLQYWICRNPRAPFSEQEYIKGNYCIRVKDVVSIDDLEDTE